MPNLVKEYNVFDAERFPNTPQYRQLMPQLRGAGLHPLNTADKMRESLEALNTKDIQLIAFWLDRYFHTVDGIAYNNVKRKIVPDAKPLFEIQPDSDLSERALILPPQYDYDKLEGEEFSIRQLEKAGLDRHLRKDEAISHPVWLALARGDKHLLREYGDAVFAELQKRDDANEGMGVYLGSKQKQPSMRAWLVLNLNLRAGAYGYDLDGPAWLVGVRSKIAKGGAQNLVRNYTPQDVQKASKALKTLKEIARPEIVEPLEALVRKA